MITSMVVVIDEGLDLPLEIAGKIVMLEKDAIFECLMPSFDLALRLWMAWRAAQVIHAVLIVPACEILGDIVRAVVRQQARLVAAISLFQP